MKKVILMIGILFVLTGKTFSQSYPNNEDGQYEDMLTPDYYLAAEGVPIRNEINEFVHFARLESFRHPLENAMGQKPDYTTPAIGAFGAVKGMAPNQEYHPGVDMHVGNNETNVVMYAVYDGYVKAYRNGLMYRDYLTLTRNVEDSIGNLLGKMVTIYGHLDLNLDSLDHRLLNGKFVHQGDTLSTHLYAGTLGGPHLHFEIRYYRPTDVGDEQFYGSFFPYLTEQSAGKWVYGLWEPGVGYGYANPENHLSNGTATSSDIGLGDQMKVYPTPTTGNIVLQLTKNSGDVTVRICDRIGQVYICKNYSSTSLISLDVSKFSSGIYFLKVQDSYNHDDVFRIIKK